MPVKYTRELLTEAARGAQDWGEAVRWCGGTPTPGSQRYLRQRMSELGIDTSHFRTARVRHTEERLRAAVAQSTSFKEVVRRLGISPVGGNQAHISRRITALGIDTSHFVTVRPGRPEGSHGEILTLRSPESGRVPGSRLRRELLRTGLLEMCAMCGVGTEWNGKPLRLEVDHRNGDWWDNRPENLQLLCPNCHAVTDTYRGRKRRSRA
ncbi:HNH endonuclease [Streptomyces sp. NBC_00390]|uniref:HNH endonuclease signature motif containing protein n=1 Tax=Streptomyces sp. NBC_00390 TaxID=2975736 RepID=UPI002E2270E8